MPTAVNQNSDEATHNLAVRIVFDNLAGEEGQGKQRYRIYAHHLARACWYGTRIMLRQCSPEAEGIFEFILELHRACGGSWDNFLQLGITQNDLDAWLSFAGMFLSSLGNYFGDGDHKVIPDISEDALRNMAKVSPKASAKLESIIDPMMATQPSSLGYPGERTQSGYYTGDENITKGEIEAISKIMEAKNIALENTRLLKHTEDIDSEQESFDLIFEILQASADKDPEPQFLGEIRTETGRSMKISLRRGDHSSEMDKICVELTKAREYAATEAQRTALSQLIKSFRTGDYEAFRDAQKAWVTDKAPRVEHCMGFLFGYRDPHGLRAEWQAAAGIAHSQETEKVRRVVEMSSEIIRTLPWAVANDNNGKGPFEPGELEVRDFAIVHVLASVSSTVWEATNITIDDDGKRHGVKSIVYGNRMSLNAVSSRPCLYVTSSESNSYMACAHIVRFIGTTIHEIIGHGTGKLLAEISPGKFNFDQLHPPVSPLTGQPIHTWYKPGETWNSVFGKLAMTVEECRAFLTANYLADNKDILRLFGYDQTSTPTADDLFNTYLHIGVEGLRALRSFDGEDRIWRGDHDQAQFAILKHILQDGGGVMRIEQNIDASVLSVHIDRSKIVSHGKASIGRMLCKISIWRSTADIRACRPYYEGLSAVDGIYEKWRQVVLSNPEPRWKFVQPNTFLREDGTVEIKEYDASNIGIIQSFYERNV
ncbi:dipeptidyl peptidase III [Nemania sp. NC0429]|nr:dipeptidyl peptidase III [Nemania sp. NC0429]